MSSATTLASTPCTSPKWWGKGSTCMKRPERTVGSNWSICGTNPSNLSNPACSCSFLIRRTKKMNDRWVWVDSTEKPAKFTWSMMVLGIVSYNSYVMLPYFFLQDFRINANTCMELLVRCWIEMVTQRKPYVFQLPSTWHKSSCCKFIWSYHHLTYVVYHSL